MNSMRILDTNIVSYSHKRDPLEKRYFRHIVGRPLAISFQTLGELKEWAFESGWGSARKARFEAFLEQYTVLESDPLVVDLWARIRVERRRQPIGVADCWIAATALAYQLELVTHNPADFAGITGLTVVSESP